MESVAELEEQVKHAEGEERAALRRKIRRLKRKEAVPMEQVRKRSRVKRYDDESPKESFKRLRQEFSELNVIEMKENIQSGDLWVLFPVTVPANVALTKYDQRFARPALLHFGFVRTTVNAWLALGPVPSTFESTNRRP